MRCRRLIDDRQHENDEWNQMPIPRIPMKKLTETNLNKSQFYDTLRERIHKACGLLPAGAIMPTLSNHALASFAKSPQKLWPLSEDARDMILGTLLGDASMGWTVSFPRYVAVHGLQQNDYCKNKFDLLKDYCGGTAPSEEVNRGYGKNVVRFSTLTTPVFEFIRYLCYRSDPTQRSCLKKAITPALVEQLNWRQIAWFYQDDGCKQSRQMHFATHDYTPQDVELLAAWFRSNGVDAKVKQVSKGKKQYWIVEVSTAGALILTEKIRPFMHPSMIHKLPLFEASECRVCGKAIPASTGTRQQFCSADHRSAWEKERSQKRYKSLTEEQRQERSRRSIELLKADPQRYSRWREYHAANQKLKTGNGPKAAAHNEWKKNYRAKRKAEGRPEKSTQTRQCNYCDEDFQNSLTHKMSGRSPFISCAKTDCMERRAEDYKDLQRARARAKWALDRSSEQ